MIVWLMDTAGPGNCAGVMFDESRAIGEAEKLITGGRAVTARVEFAYARIGGSWLTDCYKRTGNGWSASLAADGSVRWAPFSSLDRERAAS